MFAYSMPGATFLHVELKQSLQQTEQKQRAKTTPFRNIFLLHKILIAVKRIDSAKDRIDTLFQACGCHLLIHSIEYFFHQKRVFPMKNHHLYDKKYFDCLADPIALSADTSFGFFHLYRNEYLQQPYTFYF